MPANPKEPFVPLTAAGAAVHEHPDFHVTILRQAANMRPFRAGALPAPAAASGDEPQVTLHREGDRIVGIRVQCACGQAIELACIYDAPGGAG